MTTSDSELLRRYLSERSEAAFAELVKRHINLVFSAALRQVDGDAQLAEDVTQVAFSDLARKASSLTRHPSLAGWLYTSARYLASNARRSEQRRRARETQAYAMNQLLESSAPELDWEQLRPMLDEIMHILDEPDREVVLLRFFEQLSYPLIGARIGANENTVRMRVERALEKLRATLANRGMKSTAATLAALLMAQAVCAAPAGLISKVSKRAVAAAGAATTGSGLLLWLASLKAKLALAAILAAAIATPLIWNLHKSPRNPNAETKSASAIRPESSSPTGAVALATLSSGPAVTQTTAAPAGGPVLVLTLMDTQGNRVPDVRIDYRGWSKGNFKGQKLYSNRAGICEVSYPADTTELELTTRKDGYADTRLAWRPDRGQAIPLAYDVVLTEPVPIGGRVLDTDGNPVAGAKVGWNHEDDPTGNTPPQSHEFGWLEVTTDADGRWEINRIAPEMIRRLYGSARDSNYVDSPLLFVGRDATVERELKDKTHVFHLGTGFTIVGSVIDAEGNAVSGAEVLVGHVGESSRRTATAAADGSFMVAGCKPGKNPLSASADGFATTTKEIEIGSNSPPQQIVLQRGKVLRLLVTKRNGDPVRGASIWLDTFETGPINPGQHEPIPVQAEINAKTGPDGRFAWSNAPEQELTFDISAGGLMRTNGFKVRPDGEEHRVMLATAVDVSGTVRDADTGKLIPQFKVICGWPEWNPIKGTTNGHWSQFERDWLSFSRGEYRHTFQEPLIYGTPNPGYMLKFEADGYAPFVSRVIGPDEGNVKVDVWLGTATSTVVRVFAPDGTAAIGVDVGLAIPGARLSLIPGGFSRQGGFGGGNLLRTDAQGQFKLPSDDAITRVIVACAAGYAETTPTILRATPTIVLQRWGRIEGTCLSGGQPASGREYLLQLNNGDFDTTSCDFEKYRVKSDADGRFTIDMAPPGKNALLRLIRQQQGNGTTGWTHGNKTDVEVRPGETTTITLGGTGYRVTAHLQWPTGVGSSNYQIMAQLHTPMPVPPSEYEGNPELLKQFYQSPEFRQLAKTAQHYTCSIGDDGSVKAEEVPPGEYTLSVMALSGTPGHRGDHSAFSNGQGVTVTVPSSPPTGQLDVGVIALHENQPLTQ